MLANWIVAAKLVAVLPITTTDFVASLEVEHMFIIAS